jgi:hypothetical protein
MSARPLRKVARVPALARAALPVDPRTALARAVVAPTLAAPPRAPGFSAGDSPWPLARARSAPPAADRERGPVDLADSAGTRGPSPAIAARSRPGSAVSA